MKHYSNRGYITIDEVNYKVNVGEGEDANKYWVYTKQIRKIIEQLNLMLHYYSRVLVVNIILHPVFFTVDNKVVSKFLNVLNKQFKLANYVFNKIGYCWCREKDDDAIKQHYHMAFFLPARVVRHPKKIFIIIKNTWGSVGGERVWQADYHDLHRGDFEALQIAIYHLSYQAKMRTKGNRHSKVNEYSTSRLK